MNSFNSVSFRSNRHASYKWRMGLYSFDSSMCVHVCGTRMLRLSFYLRLVQNFGRTGFNLAATELKHTVTRPSNKVARMRSGRVRLPEVSLIACVMCTHHSSLYLGRNEPISELACAQITYSVMLAIYVIAVVNFAHCHFEYLFGKYGSISAVAQNQYFAINMHSRN